MDANKQPDYTSRVPTFHFSTTLKEQLAELETNPLRQRMETVRAQTASDPYRPLYHYVNPEGNLNDPNGLTYWQDRWHLFYQAYPPEDPRQHWGHAVSDDLIHWRDLPYAIYPHPEECCFSGATLVDGPQVIAMYHGTKAGNMVAMADDPLLLNWTKLGDGPVIPMEAADGGALPYTVFDPCIWKEGDAYYSLSGGTLHNGPGGKQVRANFLFRSTDLIHWTYLHPFVEDDQFTLVGDDGACPYFWPIGDRHMLLFFSHMSGGQYLLGDYDTDRQKFVVTDHGLFNFGPAWPSGVHAPSATPDGTGGIIVIFNMNPGKPTTGWDQIMTLPRRLTLDERGEVRIAPAGAVESVRAEHAAAGEQTLPANEEVMFDGVSGNAIELAIELEAGNAPALEINVLQSPGCEETTRITFYRDRGMRYRERIPNHTALNANSDVLKSVPTRTESLISLDTSRSSTLPDVRPRGPETAPVFLDADEPLRLRIFVDRSVVEVFVNDKQCVAARVYPGRDDSLGVSIRSMGQPSVLRALDCWQMKSIY